MLSGNSQPQLEVSLLTMLIFSSEGKDFIQKLLVLEPERRMSAVDCLQHPWILQAGPCRVSAAKLRWSKYTNTIRAVCRFRAGEKEV